MAFKALSGVLAKLTVYGCTSAPSATPASDAATSPQARTKAGLNFTVIPLTPATDNSCRRNVIFAKNSKRCLQPNHAEPLPFRTFAVGAFRQTSAAAGAIGS